jgi:hypothetical protein
MMDQTLQPYHQYFAMNGGAQRSITTALQTAALLQMGSPAQKAQAIAGLINQFGVDVPTVDNLLTGEDIPQEQQVTSQVQQAVQQAVAPYQEYFRSAQTQQVQNQQRMSEQAATELGEFSSSHEFYNDVAGLMADILDLGSARGQEVSLEDAYTQACAMTPEVSQVMQMRQNSQNLTQKRKAASTVSGPPSGEKPVNKPTTIRGALEAAMSEHTGM